MTLLEICVEDGAGAAAAVAGGADRIELCSALALGGLTPTTSLLEAALAHARPAGVTVHAMVRPRAGDFAYADADFALALAEGKALVAAGADGLVFGACRDGALNEAQSRAWAECFGQQQTIAGKPIELSLHRAIDLVADKAAAVDMAVALGFHRILSSGGAVSALEGAAVLREMVTRAAGRCRIAAGAGVRGGNVAQLLAQSGVDEVHASASRSAGAVDPLVVALGFDRGERRMTCRDEVAALRQAIKPQ
ncbi:copper homeostasis protein CutC [Sphingomonas sp. 37zxx]|uniref:copper homeostasis protein CutC n=1 Tax=Sphingomonas sp. 37zxx TaxID=1550073 RepID=UPI00053BF6A6|nr:copper homeostasis protein CutC [Sphingomonas sp. 37zxx]